jgi:MFS family permease
MRVTQQHVSITTRCGQRISLPYLSGGHNPLQVPRRRIFYHAANMSLRSLAITASPLQLLTYLLGVCLFSISFLVFLNSSVSFVITDRIGQKKGVGNAVGTLGFADELVALIACPIWGVLSDKIGVRTVTVAGYGIVGLALMGFVRARNVYPELLIGRMIFAVGGAAT